MVTGLDYRLTEIARVCRYNGYFLFSTFGPKSLCEWRRAWLRTGSTYAHTNQLNDKQYIENSCMQVGLKQIYVNSDSMTLHLPT